MSPTPKVTIAIPVFNGKDTLGETLQSALTQSYTNLEIIVVDDGSTDGSVNAIEKLQDPRICLIKHGSNKGIEAAWNTCLTSATGAFLILLPQDDRLLPGAVEKRMCACVKYPGFALYFGPRWIIDARGQRIMRRGLALDEGPVSAPSLISKCVMTGMNHLGDPGAVTISLAHARALQKGFSGRWPWVIDLEFWSRLLAEGGAVFLKEATSEFRLSRGALSYRLRFDQTRQFYEFALEVCKRFSLPLWQVRLGYLVGTVTQLLRNVLYFLHSRA